MAQDDILAVGPDDEFRIDENGLHRQPVQTIDMANAAHALVTGSASAAQSQLTSNMLFVDPNGGAQDLTLPAEADFKGSLRIVNVADAAEAVTVKDDGGGTIITLDQNQAGLVICNGTEWRGFMGGIT